MAIVMTMAMAMAMAMEMEAPLAMARDPARRLVVATLRTLPTTRRSTTKRRTRSWLPMALDEAASDGPRGNQESPMAHQALVMMQAALPPTRMRALLTMASHT